MRRIEVQCYVDTTSADKGEIILEMIFSQLVCRVYLHPSASMFRFKQIQRAQRPRRCHARLSEKFGR